MSTYLTKKLRHMKRITLIIALLIFTINSFSQVYFSCYYREYCDWNSYTESFTNCKGYEENSMFKIMSDETMFIHTTETMKPAYYIKSKEYDEDEGILTYNVVSDVGNKYLYVFDVTNKEVRVGIVRDDEIQMLRFKVKSIWKD